MKRIISVILILLLTVTVLSSCSDPAEVEFVESEAGVEWVLSEILENGKQDKVFTRDEFGRIVKICNYDEGSLYDTDVIEYNDRGERLSQVTVRADGSKSSEELYTYDADGNLIKKLNNYYNDKNEITTVYGNQYIYTNGRKTEAYSYHYPAKSGGYDEYLPLGKGVKSGNVLLTSVAPEREFTHYIYTYDQAGNITEKIWMDEFGNEKRKDVYKFDERGNCIEYIYAPNGKTFRTQNRKYDKSGNMTEADSFEQGNFSWSLDCEYDENGNITKYSYKGLGYDSPSVKTCEYDENGNETKYVDRNSNGVETSREESRYDGKGNLIEYTSYHRGEFQNRVVYKYNKSGALFEKQYHYKKDGKAKSNKTKVAYDKYGNPTKLTYYNSKGKVTKAVEYRWVAVKSNSYLDKESEENFMFDFNDLLLSERRWYNIEVEKPE